MATLVKLIDLNVEIDASSTEIRTLFNYLKKSLTTKQVNFSLDFIPYGKLKTITGELKYDLVVSDLYDKIIAGSNEKLSVFERPLHHSGNTDNQFDHLFSVSFEDSFHCLRLVNEEFEEFIYATTQTSVIKIAVKDLMEKKCKIIWRLEKIDSNIWGLDLWGNHVYVLDFDQTFISVINRETGLEERKEKMDISNGYGFQFLNENLILTSQANYLEIFERNGAEWFGKRRKEITNTNTAYSLFYEKGSGLIYLSNMKVNQILVVRLVDFSIVKQYSGNFKQNYGIMIDSKSGLLYVCDNFEREIFILK